VKHTVRRPSHASIAPEVAAILELRAGRIRTKRVDQSADADALFWVAEVVVGQDTYAFPLEQVRAALPLRMVSPVPLAPAHVLGMFRFRGDLLVAFSLESLLGLRGWAVDPAVLVVLEVERRLIAFDCESIPKASTLPITSIEEARARAKNEPVLSVTTPDLRIVRLVDDISKLLEPTEASRAG
jgi:chemotaxis signal transduction protein